MAHPLPLLSALAVAAVALAAGSAAPASDVEGWDVRPHGNACTMMSTFEDDVSVGLLWSAPNGEVSFMTGGGNLEKIAGKAGSTVSLNASFDGDVPHTDWTDERARVVSIGRNNVAVVADWGPALSKELADTVAGSSMVVLRIGDSRLGSYDLSGSRAAAEELERCGAQIAAD